MTSDSELKIVHIDEDFYPFQLQTEKWHGYSSHLSINPGVSSEVTLESDSLPNLSFYTVIEPEGLRSSRGKLWIEADKYQLGKLGWLKIAPQGIRLPMPPAVFGGASWRGYYIFNSDVLAVIERLRAYVSLPDGEYMATPDIFRVRRSSTRYAEGIDFNEFMSTLGGQSMDNLPVDLKDEAYLKSIRAKFSFV